LTFPDIDFQFIEQTERIGTGAAIEFLKDEHDYYFVTMGDSIFDQNDFDKFIDLFKQNPGNYIMSTKVKNPSKYGVFELENDKIINLEEKPKNPKSNSINLGCYIFDKSIFKYIAKTNIMSNGEIYITDSIKLSLNDGNLFRSYSIKNKFFDLTYKEDLE
jgi:dTDP-glucose pyrophosphorylase